MYEDALGLRFKVEDGAYLHTEEVEGAHTFAVWPLAQAAESCFGTSEWPADTTVPQAWLEFDVDDIEAATRELESGATGCWCVTAPSPGARWSRDCSAPRDCWSASP